MKVVMENETAPDGGGPVGRAGWHRRTGVLPLAYLVALVAVALVHPFLPAWRWLAIHLLLLGAATNAIMVWSAHFTTAVLRCPAPAHRRGEAIRLTVLNVGISPECAVGYRHEWVLALSYRSRCPVDRIPPV